MDTWTLSADDKDMIVMYHKFGYQLYGKKHQIDSTLVVIGEDQTYTAMAKTVGLPVAVATLVMIAGLKKHFKWKDNSAWCSDTNFKGSI